MTQSPLLLILSTLLLILMAAGIVLRTLASVVEYFATREGTPHLATGVRIVAFVFLGQGLALAVIAGVYQAAQARETLDFIACQAGYLLAAYLLSSGVFCMWWGSRLARADRMDAVERGRNVAHLLFWGAGAVAVGLCLLACFEAESAAGAILFFGLPIVLVLLVLIAAVEGMLSWNRQMERRHWDLWQMYLAVRSRRPLLEELEFLQQYSWGRQRQRLRALCEELREGADAESLFVRPAFLTATEGAHLAAGWKSGRMPQVLGEMLQRRVQFTRELLQVNNPIISVLYVWFLLLVVGMVTGFLMYWIVPKFKKIFEDFGTDLPAMTQIVISSSDAFASHWYITLPSLLAVWGLMTTAALLPFAGGMSGFREWLSRLWPRVCLPDVLRGLALTTEARLPLEEALVPFIRWQLQVPLHSRLVRVQEAVREGHDCWGELVDEKLLTPEEAGLLQSAQRAGNLPWALNALSARVERRWQFTFLFCLEFVRPALLIAVGFVVAAFDTAMFLPLVKLINDLS